MNWAELLLLLANVSHTPLSELFRLTWRQFAAYCAAMPEVAKLTSPWPTGDSDEKPTGPTPAAQINLLGAQMGILTKPKRNDD